MVCSENAGRLGGKRCNGITNEQEIPQTKPQEHCPADVQSSMISASIRRNGTTSSQSSELNKYPPGADRESIPSNSKWNCADCENTSRWWQRTRVHVALLGLAIAVVNCYAQATFCIAIVEMVLPADFAGPRLELATTPKLISKRHATANATGPIPMSDQSCPIEFKYRNYYDDWRFDDSSKSEADQKHQSSQQIDVSNRFNWGASQQGLLLGAFAIGTAPLQIIGGRLAEIYGSKWVLLMGCVGTGLTNLAIPYLAHFSFLLLLADRILMGVAQAGMEPGLICLLADWLTPQEASFFISMLLFAICLGFFLGSLCSSFILALGYGWPLTYYVCAGLNLLVALVWYLYADSWPRASKYISQKELRYITSQQEQLAASTRTGSSLESVGDDCATTTTTMDGSYRLNDDISLGHDGNDSCAKMQDAEGTKLAVEPEDPLRAPWLRILSSRPVWAFIICKISIRWCADVISNELPTYLANVLHLSIKINGVLNSVSSALFAVSSFITGWLATSKMFAREDDAANVKERNRSKTNLRKAFQSLASFGSAICLILMTRYDCDILVSMSCLLMLSCFIVMGTGGELQIAYDMTSRYPGTLHGMACTLSVSGWLAPPLYGLILGDQPSSRARWSIVWYSTAAISLFGGLVFVLFADASPRDFDEPSAKRRAKRESCRAEGAQGGHANGALASSSCESSPKSNHCSIMSQPRHQLPPESGKLNPLEISTNFDCNELIKCRQSESSFIQARAFPTPGYCLDSPLRLEANDLIYPYREKAPLEARPSAAHTSHRLTQSVWSRLARLAARNETSANPIVIITTENEPAAAPGEKRPKSISGSSNEPPTETVNRSGESRDSRANGSGGLANSDHPDARGPSVEDPAGLEPAAADVQPTKPSPGPLKQTDKPDSSPLLMAPAGQKTITHL